MSIRTNDPRTETQIKRDGKWVSIHEELRKANPMQGSCDQLQALHISLQKISALTRNSYLEGRKASEEKAFIEKEVAPIVVDFTNIKRD